MSDKKPTVFITDINTHKRIREHLSNEMDIISEEDIKNVITDFQTASEQVQTPEEQLHNA